jgi:hypothetical protein
MTRGSARRAVFRETEAALQRRGRALARLCGYRLQYHTRYSLGSDPGWLDDAFLNPDLHRFIVVEWKGPRGQLAAEQYDWAEQLMLAGIEVYVWWPDQWDEVERVFLQGERLSPW